MKNSQTTTSQSAATTGTSPATDADQSTIIYKAPFMWRADNRKRRFIALPERQFSHKTDWEILCRSVDLFLQQQDARGSFYTEEDYRSGDRVDDHLGAASALAYFLSQTGPNEKISTALERAVRFHLDHLVCSPSSTRPFRYSRFFIDRDTSGDWCNTLWTLAGGALVLLDGAPFLEKGTADELREVMADNWSYVSTFPIRDENPCHNQLLAYCEIGISVGKAIGREAIRTEVLRYYHERLRLLRVYDRGYWIYSEFNQWDANYGVLSWTALENLFAATGDSAFAEDAEQMALYFNELVSAGGYFWGGSRRDEGGLDEFLQAPVRWSLELGLDRLLLPEPAHLWRRLALDGHYVKGLGHRNNGKLAPRKTRRFLPPRPWHFQKDNCSVCLRDDFKLHHLSSAGLEIIPAASTYGFGSGLVWKTAGEWKSDPLHVRPPKGSQGHQYHLGKPIQLADVFGLTSMQRGYFWETRQWWLSAGKSVVWIGQLITHWYPSCERIEFILGNPVLTRAGGEAVPVTEVISAEGIKADTQDEAVNLSSGKFLTFGDVSIGGTAPVSFIRPSGDAFHTFPVTGGRNLRDFATSNELRVLVSEAPVRLDCRESLFFAIEIGKEAPSLSAHGEPSTWEVETTLGIFRARQTHDVWQYSMESPSGPSQLPEIGFGFHTA